MRPVFKRYGFFSPLETKDEKKIRCFKRRPFLIVRVLRGEIVVNFQRRVLARNVEFSFIVSDSERTFTFRVRLNALTTLATLVRKLPFTVILNLDIKELDYEPSCNAVNSTQKSFTASNDKNRIGHFE